MLFGSKHLDALSQIDNAEIVAAMATTREKANGVADKYSIPNRFDNYDEMLELADLDAVILATGGYGNVFYLSTNAMACNVTSTWRAHKKKKSDTLTRLNSFGNVHTIHQDLERDGCRVRKRLAADEVR